jgi:hypothetical protein
VGGERLGDTGRPLSHCTRRIGSLVTLDETTQEVRDLRQFRRLIARQRQTALVATPSEFTKVFRSFLGGLEPGG